MSSLPKANWNGQTGKRAQVSIGMHAHPKIHSKAIETYDRYLVCDLHLSQKL